MPANDVQNSKEVYGGDARRVITEEGLPALGRRSASSHHILHHSRLGDLDTELEQLVMDNRRQVMAPTMDVDSIGGWTGFSMFHPTLRTG